MHGGLAGNSSGSGAIGVVTRRGINVVLVNVTELFIHGIAIQGLTLVCLLLSAKVTRVDQLFVGFIRYHRVAPPICHRPYVIIVVVCHCIPHLHQYIYIIYVFSC